MAVRRRDQELQRGGVLAEAGRIGDAGAAQAQALFFAAQEGTIGLMLRPFGDTTSTRIEPLLRLEPLGSANGSLVRN